MKQRFAFKGMLAILIIALVPMLWGCGGGGGKSTPEPSLAVTMTPANGTVVAPALAPFNLNVTITSTMPAAGVTISVIATKDGSSTTFFSNSKSTTTASNDYTITGQTLGDLNVVTVTVKSNNTPSNTWTGSYRFTQKG
jgi:YbbR domain-containing protein